MRGIETIEDEIVDGRVKGLPWNAGPMLLREVGEQGWNVAADDLPLPLLAIRRSAMVHNVEVMQRYCDVRGILLAPHGKTTMAPQIFKLQMDAGAWGITASTTHQLEICRAFGFRRVFLANQVVGAADLRQVCSLVRSDAQFELYVFVDSARGAELLAAAALNNDVTTPIAVLLEIGYRGGRTGVRGPEQMDAVLKAVDDSNGRLRMAGVTAFEGLLPIRRFAVQDTDQPDGLGVSEYLGSVVSLVDSLVARGAVEDGFIVTAGGSAAFDAVVEAFAGRWGTGRLVLRAGCYVTHDHGMYAATSPLRAEASAPEGVLRPALELWSHVQSRPEPELAFLTFGRRDAPFDYGFPVPLARLPAQSKDRLPADQCEVVGMNDQHAYLRVPAEYDLEVGDRIVCGISHPCTAFDKWSHIPVVDDEETVVGTVRTFF